MICSPFTPYLTVTIAFNVPLIMFGWQTFEDNATFCEKVWWLWGNSVMALFHIIGSIYIVYRIQEDKEPFDQLDEAVYDESPSKFYPRHKAVTGGGPPQTTTVHIVGLAGDDVSELDGGTAAVVRKNSSGDSKEPLNVEIPYHNMGNGPPFTSTKTVGSPRPLQVGSPKSVGSPRSVSSKTQSPFRTIFANPREPQRPDKIESVASLVAGLPDEEDRANTLQRIGKVLCYDPGTAVYLGAAVLWVVWQSVGVGVAMSLATRNDAHVAQCEEIKEWVVLSTVCGFFYMMLVLFAFGCSLLCLR